MQTVRVEGKTVFDFCDDEETLKNITGYNSTEKEKYIDLSCEINRYGDIIDFARITKDRALGKAAIEAREKAWAAFNEAADAAMQEGFILD